MLPLKAAEDEEEEVEEGASEDGEGKASYARENKEGSASRMQMRTRRTNAIQNKTCSAKPDSLKTVASAAQVRGK